jgi:hypothetical protein
MTLRIGRLFLVFAMLLVAVTVQAQPPPASASASARSAPPPQGVAVLAAGVGPSQGPNVAREEAFALARAVYGSSLRPRGLDELRARILAGDPAPPATSNEIRDLAELRASIVGTDAASRRLLTSIGQQINVQAFLVVLRAAARPDEGLSPSAAAEPSSPADTDAGAPATPAREPAAPRVMARLFVVDAGEFDAARYEPDTASPTPWRATVTSLSGRFPPPPAPPTAELRGPPPRLSSEGKDSKPFYLSPWIWGAVGAAVLIGGFFYFAAQDTSEDPIHLQMRVPR